MNRDEAKRVDGRHWELICLQCGQPFLTTRRDAKYCPDGRCRQIIARRKKDLRRAANRAILQVRSIHQLMRKYPDLEFIGAIELERIESMLSVTAGVTEKTAPVSVTLAAATDKPCVKCGKIATVSPASGLCLDCLRSKARNS
jgi:hypothetical protein